MAYAEYLRHSTKTDKARQDAIARLAELEFELGNKLMKEKENLAKGGDEDLDDKLYNSRLDKTIELLSTSIKEYPKSRKNDQILYNLANAYDQKGDQHNSEIALQRLVKNHPKSPYYIESQFRLAEIAFSRQQYSKAEDAYTDVIVSKKNERFYEKARFKRGWARFKQEYYIEAVDDFLDTVTYHDFSEYDQLNNSEKDMFEEYFRAIGLSFSYLGGVEKLNQYFADKPDFKYLYYTYAHIGEIYEKQFRFSDAAETQSYFIKTHPDSPNVPLAQLKIFNIWKKGGFANRVYESLDKFYDLYNP
ncbi:MAG: tetratricopeptide repeat protein, partial [Gammaproteobacteria bacterium]|nr:tetratricopeptide repeat protein [Gammaproteobacteria bacterium]